MIRFGLSKTLYFSRFIQQVQFGSFSTNYNKRLKPKATMGILIRLHGPGLLGLLGLLEQGCHVPVSWDMRVEWWENQSLLEGWKIKGSPSPIPSTNMLPKNIYLYLKCIVCLYSVLSPTFPCANCFGRVGSLKSGQLYQHL